MNKPCDLSAFEARRLIGARQLSPIELLDSCIERIESVNPSVNAMVATCYERAREEAQVQTDHLMTGQKLAPLFGLPLGVKDLEDTEGLVTTYGSPLYRDHVPDEDELLVARLRKAGAIVVGKTATPEFGAGGNTTVNPVHGYTGNAFDPSRACGGSSGGSGVALSCGMLPLCTGSDSGGSLRKPATFSGVSAIRPTTGLVPSDTRRVGLTNFGVQGPMARTARDCALMLSVMAGNHSQDPMAFNVPGGDYRELPVIDLSGLRIAVSVDLGFAPVASAIRALFLERLGKFKGIFRCCEFHDPVLDTALDVFWILRGVNFLVEHLDHYRNRSDELGVLVDSFNRMTREISIAQNDVRNSQLAAESQRAYLETVLEHLSSGVMSFDTYARLHTHNTAAERILDESLSQHVGSSVEDISISLPTAAPFLSAIQRGIDDDNAEWQNEINVSSKLGRQTLLCSGTKLPGAESDSGWVVVFDDATELIKAQRDAAWGEVARRLDSTQNAFHSKNLGARWRLGGASYAPMANSLYTHGAMGAIRQSPGVRCSDHRATRRVSPTACRANRFCLRRLLECPLWGLSIRGYEWSSPRGHRSTVGPRW